MDLKFESNKGKETFVASNDVSLLEAYLAEGSECRAFPFAVCRKDRTVGFLMIGSTRRRCTICMNKRVRRY